MVWMPVALHLPERGHRCAFPKVLAHAGEDAQPLAGASSPIWNRFRKVCYPLGVPRKGWIQVAMASFQAHLAVWILKWRTKRRLKHCRDYRLAREILRPLPYKPPAAVRITNASLNGVPGEWVESPSSSQDMLLLYLHGGGYFACSAETHRPITAFFAMHGFRVFAPDYRLAPENP